MATKVDPHTPHFITKLLGNRCPRMAIFVYAVEPYHGSATSAFIERDLERIVLNRALQRCHGDKLLIPDAFFIPARTDVHGKRGARSLAPVRTKRLTVSYFMASRSSRQACSQRRQASAQTRQCSCIRA